MLYHDLTPQVSPDQVLGHLIGMQTVSDLGSFVTGRKTDIANSVYDIQNFGHIIISND